MTTRSEAEETLRVIRSLMERATLYRAISAPVALIGGLAALLGCGLVGFKSAQPGIEPFTANALFLRTWLIVLAIAAVTNVFFLRRDSQRRGDPFISPGMKAALRALLPSHLIALVLTILWADSPHILPRTWMLCYGLGLLAMQHFAPRSLTLLGWAFLVAGLATIFAFPHPTAAGSLAFLQSQNLAMGATFGLLHLIYAACAWPRIVEGANGHEP